MCRRHIRRLVDVGRRQMGTCDLSDHACVIPFRGGAGNNLLTLTFIGLSVHQSHLEQAR